MKKILAILVSAALLLGLLAGCGDKTPEATDPTNSISTPVAAGMLVLNANASVNISYDSDGLVLNVEGIDTNGEALAGEYTDYLGKSCSDAVCDLIVNSKMGGFLTEEINYVMIKVAVGSALPGATFLETIQDDANNAIDEAGITVDLVMLTEENLDADGYIDLESAKALMLAALALESFDTLDGTVTPVNGLYGFSITAGDLEGDYIVDGVSGLVVEGQLEGFEYDETLEEEEIVDPTDEVYIEDTTAPAGGEDVVEPEPEPEPEA